MRRFSLRSLSWMALFGAILMWLGVAYFASIIVAEKTEHAARLADMAQEDVKQAAFQRVHTLARDTTEARGQLESLLHTDVNEMLDGVEAVARDSGVRIEISQASSGSAPTRDAPLQTTNFIVSAEGSFGKLAQVAALLQAFPTPSIIDELQFEHIESADNKSSPWRIVVRMRVFTTAELPV